MILFLGYLGSITFFTHVHILDNGVIIVHSHPFKSESDTIPFNHQHSKNDFVIINLLTHFLTTIFSVAVVIAAFNILLKKYIIQKNDKINANLLILSSIGLRAPPFKYTN